MVYLVCGPPGAGKTTYVSRHISPGDIRIDFDLLGVAMTNCECHEHEEILWPRIIDVRDYLMATIDSFPEVRNTWVVMGAPLKSERDYWRKQGAEIVLLDVSERECIEHIRHDRNIDDNRQRISRWWRMYEPD